MSEIVRLYSDSAQRVIWFNAQKTLYPDGDGQPVWMMLNPDETERQWQAACRQAVSKPCEVCEEPLTGEPYVWFHRLDGVAQCANCRETQWWADGYEIDSGIPSCWNQEHSREQRIAERECHMLEEATPQWKASAEGMALLEKAREKCERSKPDIVLQDDELIDAKKLVPSLTFIERKELWGVYLQGSVRQIPEEDFRLIESEMKKVVAERVKREEAQPESTKASEKSESDIEAAIMALPLKTQTLHDRLGEMLEEIGSWLNYNAQTRHKIIPDHAYELDVAWLSGKNPEVAIEIQISGNLTEAKDRLAHARKFNYRKVILVCRKTDLLRVNVLLKHKPELRNWMEAWSIGAVYKMYVAGAAFFKYYRRLIESVYKEKSDIELVI